jgi:putative oxygen-independent coproporphyrinogen III oxidase
MVTPLHRLSHEAHLDSPVDAFTGLSAARFGVYVHFPWCLSKCPYCDFASTSAKVIPEERYTRALLRELIIRTEGMKGQQVDSIFFGGGTPSLWRADLVGQVLDALAAKLSIAAHAEVTLEANPGASDAERFAAYRSAGVNRLSIGVQSFQPATLKALGREHDGPLAVAAFDKARKAGFDNLSLDFIYGVHGQAPEQALADAQKAASLQPEHLSAYALTLDKEALAEEVPLAKQLARGEVTLPPDEQVTGMQRAVEETYANAGLARYEVSNYAKPGRHSRHNALYWTGGEYLALGVGATGRLGLRRYSNQRSADKYLAEVEAQGVPTSQEEALDDATLFRERLAMGLRLTNGLDLEALCRAYSEDYGPRRAQVEMLTRHGLLKHDGGRVQLTPAGFDVHSAVCARLM